MAENIYYLRIDKDESSLNIGVPSIGTCNLIETKDPEKASFSIVFGGDGTVLASTRSGIVSPVIVVNTGHLGFLTSCDIQSLEETIRTFGWDSKFENRNLLEASVDGAKFLCLNDLVIARNSISKLVKVAVYVSESGSTPELISEYRVDGLIIATPTGSTAYSLSAGGPIVHPKCKSFIVSPICPQGLTQRPLVLPSDVVLHIKPLDDNLHLSMDGHIDLPIGKNSEIVIRYSDKSIFTVNPKISYYEVLRQKLAWGVKPI